MRPTALVLLASCLTGCGKTAEPEPPATPPVPATAADYAAAQGKWTITRVEQGGGVTSGSEPFRDFEVTIEDQWVTITMKGLGSFHAVIALDAEKTPKHLDLAETDENGNPRARFLPGKAGDVIAAIYKIEGDTLVLAAAMRPGEPRPTEFKATTPAPGRTTGVTVVYLMKK